MNHIFKHKVLDFAKLERLPCFHWTIEQIQQIFLKGFMQFNHGLNREVILQLYATLYISRDFADSNTWVFEWMTEEQKITCFAYKFTTLLKFPRFKCWNSWTPSALLGHLRSSNTSTGGSRDCWGCLDSKAQIHLSIHSEIVEDACTDANRKMGYENKVLFYNLFSSATPTSRPETIGGIVENALHAISLGIWFDLSGLFIQNMAYVADSAQVLRPYAPWIMHVVD